MVAAIEIPIASPAVRYTASEALAIARSYFPGARVFVSFGDVGGLSVGYLTDSGTVAAQFHGRTFNQALALAEPQRFPA